MIKRKEKSHHPDFTRSNSEPSFPPLLPSGRSGAWDRAIEGNLSQLARDSAEGEGGKGLAVLRAERRRRKSRTGVQSQISGGMSSSLSRTGSVREIETTYFDPASECLNKIGLF
jgi:hypothetical protein